MFTLKGTKLINSLINSSKTSDVDEDYFVYEDDGVYEDDRLSLSDSGEICLFVNIKCLRFCFIRKKKIFFDSILSF